MHGTDDEATLRIKKLIGFTLFLPALIVYFFAAAALGELVPFA